MRKVTTIGITILRFDDRLNTVLKGSLPEGLAAALQWRQVADLLAQKPGDLANEDVQMGLTRLRDLHDRVSESDRLSAVEALDGRLRSAPLLVYLCADQDSICDAAIVGADLSEESLADVFPQLSARAQSRLKSTGQFVEKQREAEVPIAIYAQDHLPASDSQTVTDLDPSPESGKGEGEETAENSQISALVDKIADYQKNRSSEAARLPREDEQVTALAAAPANEINFETDETGTIIWTEGSPKGAIIGVTIAQPTFDDGPGPDAYGAAAFRQRMPLENARMRLCGAQSVAGDWRMRAIPYFSEDSGRFKGYRGIMRRPNAAEDVGVAAIDFDRQEQLQQLIHELRTPLNAIIGFSEIIEQQLFGPASFEYRTLARSIMDEARRLLTGFEDLDIAAKIDSGQLVDEPGLTDPNWLFDRMAQRLQSLTHSRMVELSISKAEPVRAFAMDEPSIERIYARLLSAAIISCENGEALVGELRTRIGINPMNIFTLSRPSRIKDISEKQLLDPSQGIDGDENDSSLLGLGFSLRLVRNLAQAASGSLTIQADKIALTLPAARTSDISIQETEIE